MNTFDLGETVVCSVHITDATGADKSPTVSMKISITDPASQIVAATDMTNDATGYYHYDYNSSSTGLDGQYLIQYIATDGTTSRITIEKEYFKLE